MNLESLPIGDMSLGALAMVVALYALRLASLAVTHRRSRRPPPDVDNDRHGDGGAS